LAEVRVKAEFNVSFDEETEVSSEEAEIEVLDMEEGNRP